MRTNCSTIISKKYQHQFEFSSQIKSKRESYKQAVRNNTEVFNNPELISDESDSNIDLYIPYKLYKKSLNTTNDIEKMLSWRKDDIHTIFNENPEKSEGQLVFSNNPIEENLSKISNNLQGLFINIDWNHRDGCQNKYADNDRIFEELSKNLQISQRQMSNGLLFIWTSKRHIAQMISLMHKNDFKMVDNIIVCQLDTNVGKISKVADLPKGHMDNEEINGETFNPFATPKIIIEANQLFYKTSNKSSSILTLNTELKNLGKKSQIEFEKTRKNRNDYTFIESDPQHSAQRKSDDTYFKCSKLNLLIFRRAIKETKLELRHQRNADCFFDVYQKDYPNGQDDIGKERIYNIIEKLLPKAITTKQDLSALKQLEINGSKNREGWITIASLKE